MTTPNQQQVMTHVILLIPKTDTSDKDLENLFQAARTLKKHIPCLLSIAAGENHSTGHRGFTHGIIMHFTDETHQRDAVQQSVYLKLRDKATRLCEQIVAFDLPETLPLPAQPAPSALSQPGTRKRQSPAPLATSPERLATVPARVPRSTTMVDARLVQIIVDQLDVESNEVTHWASYVEDLNADSLDLVELIMSLSRFFTSKFLLTMLNGSLL